MNWFKDTIENLYECEKMLNSIDETHPAHYAIKMLLRENKTDLNNMVIASEKLRQTIHLTLKLKPQTDEINIIATHYLTKEHQEDAV